MPPKPREVTARPVTAAVEAKNYVGALQIALGLWRTARDPVIADVIDAIAARCRPPAIAGRDSAAFHIAWLTLADSQPGPVAVGALAANLFRRLPVREVGYFAPSRDLARNVPFLARVALLSRSPDDPRVATALVDVVERAPYGDSGRLYAPVLALIERIADLRCVPRLQALLDRPIAKSRTVRSYYADALPATIQAIETAATAVVPLDEDERGAFTELVTRLAGKRSAPVAHHDVGQLLAECLARPDDDAPREVLADALLEREDPRGELIALQLREPTADDAVRRVATLIRKHEKEWLGDLARVTKVRVWRRGFLEQAELQGHAVADEETWQRASIDRSLATVRALFKGRGTVELYRMFVLSPAMRSLREITVPTTAFLEEVVEAGKRLDHLVLELGLTRKTLAMLDAVVDRTGAGRLTFKAPAGPALRIAEVPAIRRFDELVALVPDRSALRSGPDLPGWLAAHAALSPVRRLGLQLAGARVIAEAGRGDRGPRIEIESVDDRAVATALGWIGPFEHLTLRGAFTGELRSELATALDRLDPDARELRDGWARFAATDRGRVRRARRP